MYSIAKRLAGLYKVWSLNTFRVYGEPILYLVPAPSDVKKNLYDYFIGGYPTGHEESLMAKESVISYYAGLLPVFFSNRGDDVGNPPSAAPGMWREEGTIFMHISFFREVFETYIGSQRYPLKGDLIYIPNMAIDGPIFPTGDVSGEDARINLDGSRFYKILSVSRYIRGFYTPTDSPIFVLTVKHFPVETALLSADSVIPKVILKEYHVT